MFSNIGDDEMDDIVREASNSHPNFGLRMMKGYLQSKGVHVQRKRIRYSLLRIDPIGLMQRWKMAIKRQTYNVKYPLSLWHIDGNHKLIK
jgi:repressor of nif and glnA expression